MNFEIKKLPHEPIVFASMNSKFRVEDDYPALHAEMHNILDQQRDPVFYIVDLSATHFDLDELTIITSGAARGTDANFHHPKVRQIVLITTSSVYKVVIDNMKMDVYGRVAAVMVPSIEEALDYVRSQ